MRYKQLPIGWYLSRYLTLNSQDEHHFYKTQLNLASSTAMFDLTQWKMLRLNPDSLMLG